MEQTTNSFKCNDIMDDFCNERDNEKKNNNTMRGYLMYPYMCNLLLFLLYTKFTIAFLLSRKIQNSKFKTAVI